MDGIRRSGPRLRSRLRSVRAYLLKEQFQDFWTYTSVGGARRFFACWTTMAMRSRLPPFKEFARTLREHQRELLNWFIARRARRRFAAGATEGFNNKARVTTRKAYGFRTYEHPEIALYLAPGDLPNGRGSPTDSADEATGLSCRIGGLTRVARSIRDCGRGRGGFPSRDTPRAAPGK